MNRPLKKKNQKLIQLMKFQMIHVQSFNLLRNKTNLNERNKLNLQPFKLKNSPVDKFVMLVQVACSLTNVDKTSYTFKEFLSKTK
jgi:hypothetical protein